MIFNDDVEFYCSRPRILEKLNPLPTDLLPTGVQPTLGPDATTLDIVYWYTIEGRDKNGYTTEGWDLQDIRTVQDLYIKNGLNGVDSVAEVASVGGYQSTTGEKPMEAGTNMGLFNAASNQND